MDNVKPKSPFVRSLVIDRDSAIAFLKTAGFVETAKAGVFTRDNEHSAAQKAAGARVLTTVDIEELIASPKVWRLFVHRWSKRLAAKANP